MIYNFRHDRNITSDIADRIRSEKEISQGWGGCGDVDLNLRDENFINKTFKYHKCRTTRTPSNLTYMRDFKDGDLLVMPRLPTYGTVSIHIVDGDYPDCYRYDTTDQTSQNHRIKVGESFGLDGGVQHIRQGSSRILR